MATLSTFFDNIFETLKSKKQNTVDGIVNWMKEARIIEQKKDAEDSARKMFGSVKDQANVQLTEFKSAVTKLAEDKKMTADTIKNNMKQKLAETGTSVANEVNAGVSQAVDAGKAAISGGLGTFKDAFSKKK